mmetsp:Transcript_40010/g.93923  ORF Transcript_40010/g.93923 Transcript_40010/m.93923 type:complete len:111 (+) Transcript_40010:237-569(+)
MSTEYAEAEINPDGTTNTGAGDDFNEGGGNGTEGTEEEFGSAPTGPESLDPAYYVVGIFFALLALAGLIYFMRRKRRRDRGFDDADELFSSLDGKEVRSDQRVLLSVVLG